MKFDELVDLAREKGLFERIIGSDGDGELKPADKSAFGKLLKRYDRRVFSGGKSFVVDGKGHSRTFRVVSTHGRHGQHGVSTHRENDQFPYRLKYHADRADHADLPRRAAFACRLCQSMRSNARSREDHQLKTLLSVTTLPARLATGSLSCFSATRSRPGRCQIVRLI